MESESNTNDQNIQETAETQPVEKTIEEQLEHWKTHARTWESRAKANEEAASKLQEIEDAQKSELQKLQEAKESLEKDLADARFEAMRGSIATEYGISKEDTELFLTGTDSESLKRQAEALKARTATSTPPVGNVVPGLGDRKLGDPAQSKDELARSVFGI